MMQRLIPSKAILASIVLAALAAGAGAEPFEYVSIFEAEQGAPKQDFRLSALLEDFETAREARWQRDTYTGDWHGLRDTLKDAGIVVNPVYEAEVFGSAGGGHGGVISDGLLDVELDFDLQRMTHMWQGALFHLNVLDIYGSSLSHKFVGDLGGTSNLAAFNTFRLQEMWLEQSFWNKRASLRAGMLAADSEFFESKASNLELNGTFDAFTLLTSNFKNAPAYPVAAPAVRLDVTPVPVLDFKAGVFAPNEDAEKNNHGTDFSVNPKDGALIALETSYRLNQAPNDHGLIGTYTIGTFIQQGDYATWASQAAHALDPSRPLSYGTNYMAYGVADQEVFKHGQLTVEAFVHAGFASSSFSLVQNYWDAGFDFIGPAPNRSHDHAGIAIARSGISKQYSHSLEEQGKPGASSETVIELTYKCQFTRWGAIQPDLQYLINPSGRNGSRNAFVFGLRTVIAF